jgi:hypothetical protein
METLNVSQYLMMGIALATFAALGWRRGVNRELLQVVGITLALLVSNRLAVELGPAVNKFYKLGRFALSGGLTSDDPTAAWRRAQALPELVKTPDQIRLLALVVFSSIVGFFYLWGQQQIAGPGAWALKFLGLCTGAVNGFLITYYLLPILLPKPQAVIKLHSGELQQTLVSSQTIAYVVSAFVIILIAFGLYSASSSRRK